MHNRKEISKNFDLLWIMWDSTIATAKCTFKKYAFKVVSKQILRNLRKIIGNLCSSWLVSGGLFQLYSSPSFRRSFGGPGKGILLGVFRVEDAQSERIIIWEKCTEN